MVIVTPDVDPDAGVTESKRGEKYENGNEFEKAPLEVVTTTGQLAPEPARVVQRTRVELK